MERAGRRGRAVVELYGPARGCPLASGRVCGTRGGVAASGGAGAAWTAGSHGLGRCKCTGDAERDPSCASHHRRGLCSRAEWWRGAHDTHEAARTASPRFASAARLPWYERSERGLGLRNANHRRQLESELADGGGSFGGQHEPRGLGQRVDLLYRGWRLGSGLELCYPRSRE